MIPRTGKMCVRNIDGMLSREMDGYSGRGWLMHRTDMKNVEQ